MLSCVSSVGKLGFKGIAHSKINYCFLSSFTHPYLLMFFENFFMWNTTGDVWCNVHAALFHIMKVNGDLGHKTCLPNKSGLFQLV